MLLHKNCTKKFNFKTIFHLSAFYAKLMKSDVEQEIRRSSTEAQNIMNLSTFLKVHFIV